MSDTKKTSHTMQAQPNNPLHGITLAHMLTELQAHFGWQGLASRIPVNCFSHEPSIQSSLKFLRRTPWARAKLEALYGEMTKHQSNS